MHMTQIMLVASCSLSVCNDEYSENRSRAGRQLINDDLLAGVQKATTENTASAYMSASVSVKRHVRCTALPQAVEDVRHMKSE